jgi:rhodanese-related sulfurtransferase
VLGGYAAWEGAGLPITTPDTAEQAGSTPQAGARACKALVDRGALLLDVREPEEWQAEHATVAVLIPMGQVRSRQTELHATAGSS